MDFGHLLGNGPVNANWYCSRCDGQCVACEHGERAVTVQRSFKYEIVFLSALEELSSAIQLRVLSKQSQGSARNPFDSVDEYLNGREDFCRVS
jgi:hypothetical protein